MGYNPSANNGGQSYFGGSRSTNSGNAGDIGYSNGLTSKVKNPAIDSLLTGQMGQFNQNNSANQNDLNNFSSTIYQNQARNAGYQAQEGGAIDRLYNGGAAGDLSRTTNAYRDNAGKLIDHAEESLGTSLADYRRDAGNQINSEVGARAKLESDYKGTAQAALDKNIADLTASRNNLAASLREGTNITEAAADRDRKMRETGTGGGQGAQSYFNRGMILDRNNQENALATQIGGLARQDIGTTNAQQVSLNADLADRIRADTGLTEQEKANLIQNLATQGRADIGYISGQRLNANRDYTTMAGADQRYILDAQGRYVGARAREGRLAANDLLAPISARNAVESNNLNDINQISQIDRGNRFYDDGGDRNSIYQPGGYRGGGGFSGDRGYGGRDNGAAVTQQPNGRVSSVTPDSLYQSLRDGKINQATYRQALDDLNAGRDPAQTLNAANRSAPVNDSQNVNDLYAENTRRGIYEPGGYEGGGQSDYM